MMISDRTLGELLQRRYSGLRIFQLFARKLGPNDVVYLSALAWGPDDNVVEIKASAMTYADAFVQLLNNAELATAPEEP